MKVTTANQEILSIRYCDLQNVLQINSKRISLPTCWDSRMYSEKFFRGIAVCDNIAKHGIRSANALLTDYNYHNRSKEYFDKFWEVWTDMYNDKDDEETALSILAEAEAYCADVLLHCLTKGWKQRQAYIEASLCLLYEVNRQRNERGLHQGMSKVLQTILQGL